MTTNTSVASFCHQISQHLASQLGPQRYDMWFGRSAKLDYLGDDQCLQVTVPSRFAADWIQRHFQAPLHQAAQQVLGHPVTLRFQVGGVANPAAPTDAPPPPPPSAPSAPSAAPAATSAIATFVPQTTPAFQAGQVPSSGQAAANDARAHVADQINHHQTQRYAKAAASGLAIRYHLNDFIVGPNNELAYLAAQNLVGVSLSPASHGSSAGSPGASVGGLGGARGAIGGLGGLGGVGGGGGGVFVHGGVGLGKTHLLQGICRRMLEHHPGAQVLYTTGEQFTNDFVWSVKQNQIEAFRRKMRRLDLLAVDDVHFIANKSATQQEFLHCFNAIELTGARIVLASDCHPKLIQQFSQALVSRCVQGMVVEIKPPDVATRVKLVHALAQRRRMTLSDAAASAMAHQCHGSIREIEGALAKLQAMTMLLPPSADQRTSSASGPVSARPIEGGLVHRLFSLDNRPCSRRPVPISEILALVADRLNVSRERITRACRRKETVLARSLVVYLARSLTAMSYPEIATALGRASHSTVITADQRLRRQLTAGDLVTLISGDGMPQETNLSLLVQELTAKLRPAS